MTKDNKIEKEFENMLRKKMTNRQFWDWVEEWLDPAIIIDICLDWDIPTKALTLSELKSTIKNNKKKK